MFLARYHLDTAVQRNNENIAKILLSLGKLKTRTINAVCSKSQEIHTFIRLILSRPFSRIKILPNYFINFVLINIVVVDYKVTKSFWFTWAKRSRVFHKRVIAKIRINFCIKHVKHMFTRNTLAVALYPWKPVCVCTR